MINLFEKLPKEDVCLAENYIANQAGWGGNYCGKPVVPMSDILKPWNEAKQDLYKLLNEQLILSQEVEFSLSTTEIADKMGTDLLNKHPFIDDYYKWLRATYYDCESGNYNWDLYSNLCKLVDSWYLAKNSLDFPEWVRDFEITLPNHTKPMKISRGMKPLRALGKIAKAYGIDANFEDFRIAHSMILNNVKAKGELCLSIHPMDYMTMSDNENDWESCMSWYHGGEYRQGTVEMMNSPFVVVGYLKSSSRVYHTTHGDWNSKKWRQLFIVDEQGIIAVRPYPYTNDEVTDYILDELKKLAEKNMGWKYINDKVITVDNYKYDNKYKDKVFHVNLETSVMYNDCGANLRCYIGELENNYLNINYSGLSECMKCGSTYTRDMWPAGECDLLCDNCDEPRAYCENCGDRHPIDEMILIDGNYYCEWCASEESFTCPCCDETYFHDSVDTVEVDVVCRTHDPEYNWDIYSPFGKTLCYRCADDIEEFLKENNIKYEGGCRYGNMSFYVEELKNAELRKFLDVSESHYTNWWENTVKGRREKEYLDNPKEENAE